jgi:hypothetical protein
MKNFHPDDDAFYAAIVTVEAAGIFKSRKYVVVGNNSATEYSTWPTLREAEQAAAAKMEVYRMKNRRIRLTK